MPELRYYLLSNDNRFAAIPFFLPISPPVSLGSFAY